MQSLQETLNAIDASIAMDESPEGKALTDALKKLAADIAASEGNA
jgi:hypothetical protein